MSLIRKIAYNTLWQILGRGLGLFFSLISLGLITRYLGLIGFGNYVTIFAFLQLFSIFVDFGLTLMSIQLISEITDENEHNDPASSQEKVNNIFSNIFTLRLVSAIILLSLAPIVVWFFPYPTQVKYGVLISSLGFLFISLAQILQSVFQKNLRMNKSALAEAISKLLFLIGVYGVTIKDWHLYGVLVFLVLANLIHFLLMFYWSREFVRVRFLVQWPVWREIFRRSWPISLSIIFNLVYLKADILILSLYSGQEVVAIYGAAYRAIDVLTVFPYLFVGLIFPILSAAWVNKNREQFIAVLQRGFESLTIIAVPLVVGVIFLAEPLIILIAGKEFASSGNVLKVLIIALGMIYLGNVFGHSIVALNKQKQMMWGYLFAAVTSLVGYFIFIPRYSYWGAAGVTLYSETIVAIMTLVMVARTIKKWPNFTVLFKSILASGVMALFLWLAAGWNLFIIMPVAAIVYFGVMLTIGGIDKKLMWEILKLK